MMLVPRWWLPPSSFLPSPLSIPSSSLDPPEEESKAALDVLGVLLLLLDSGDCTEEGTSKLAWSEVRSNWVGYRRWWNDDMEEGVGVVGDDRAAMRGGGGADIETVAVVAVTEPASTACMFEIGGWWDPLISAGSLPFAPGERRCVTGVKEPSSSASPLIATTTRWSSDSCSLPTFFTGFCNPYPFWCEEFGGPLNCPLFPWDIGGGFMVVNSRVSGDISWSLDRDKDRRGWVGLVITEKKVCVWI